MNGMIRTIRSLFSSIGEQLTTFWKIGLKFNIIRNVLSVAYVYHNHVHIKIFSQLASLHSNVCFCEPSVSTRVEQPSR